jgi:hypothetical protein
LPILTILNSTAPYRKYQYQKDGRLADQLGSNLPAGAKNDYRFLPVSINIKDTKEYKPKKASGCFTT